MICDFSLNTLGRDELRLVLRGAGALVERFGSVLRLGGRRGGRPSPSNPHIQQIRMSRGTFHKT